jgi:hypothetical protein
LPAALSVHDDAALVRQDGAADRDADVFGELELEMEDGGVALSKTLVATPLALHRATPTQRACPLLPGVCP